MPDVKEDNIGTDDKKPSNNGSPLGDQGGSVISENEDNLGNHKIDSDEGDLEDLDATDNIDDEISLIRDLISAEVNADAIQLLQTQDKVLSKISKGSEIDTKVLKKVKDTLESPEKFNTFDLPLGDYSSENIQVSSEAVDNTQRQGGLAASVLRMFQGQSENNSVESKNPKVKRTVRFEESPEVFKKSPDVLRINIQSIESAAVDSLTENVPNVSLESMDSPKGFYFSHEESDQEDDGASGENEQRGKEANAEEEKYLEVKIDEKMGLDDKFIPYFFDTFEEEERLETFMESIDIKSFQIVFDCDPLFGDEFRWWCRVCLRARRYRIQRALELLKKYSSWRLTVSFFIIHRRIRSTETLAENTLPITANDLDISADVRRPSTLLPSDICDRQEVNRFKEHVQSGTIVFLEGARCVEGRGVVICRLFLHDENKYNSDDITLCLHNVMHHAIKVDPILQAVGFTVIIDMSRVKNKSVSMDTVKLLSATLQKTLPIRHGRIILYNPGFFLKTLHSWASLFFSAKMRSRMTRVLPDKNKKPETIGLFKYITQDNLPSFFAGKRNVNTLELAEDVCWSIGLS